MGVFYFGYQFSFSFKILLVYFLLSIQGRKSGLNETVTFLKEIMDLLLVEQVLP